jgi:tRNA1(Val) A37 N6-methylase TrmN6
MSAVLADLLSVGAFSRWQDSFDVLRHRQRITEIVEKHERQRGTEVEVDNVRIKVSPGTFNPLFGTFSRRLGAVVEAKARPSLRVLDLGCGSGYLGLRMARRGCQVLGVDSNQECADSISFGARENGVDISFDLSSVKQFGNRVVGFGPFDVVIANLPFSREDRLSYIQNSPYYHSFAAPQGLLTDAVRVARRVLCDGGEIIMCYGSSGWLDELDSVCAQDGVSARVYLDEQTESGCERRWVIGLTVTKTGLAAGQRESVRYSGYGRTRPTVLGHFR